MELSRVRGGELIAALGGIALLIALLFLNWYESEAEISIGFVSAGVEAELGAWDRQGFLGTLANLVILAAGIVAVGLAALTAASRTVALPVAASALTAAGGFSAVAMVLLRMLFQPGPGEDVGLELGIYVALAGALAVAYGGWRSMQEQGTTFEDARDQLGSRLGGADEPASAGETPPREGPPETS